MLTRVLLAIVAGVAAVLGAAAPSAQSGFPLGPTSHARYLEHVKYLASDELGGRGNGAPGLERAAEYIADRFEQSGLTPAGEGGAWFQPFEIVTGLEVLDGNTLAVSGAANGRAPFELGRTYMALSVAPATDREAASALALPVVFAGYGISAPTLDYDDYGSVDVKGKAVLAFMHEPQEDDPTSRFDGRAFTQHASLMQKAMVARAQGARLLLLVLDPSHEHDTGSFRGWLQDPQADDYGITVMRVHRDRMAEALGGSFDLAAAARAIDGDLRPRSRAIDGMTVHATEHFRKVRRDVRNVVAVLNGADPSRRAEAVVVGAHYDHLGLGGRHSMAPDASGQIHNGADDNASGTAALLEIARAAASAPRRFSRSVIFAAFAGEELGLLGSARYVDKPAVPLDRTIAMVNLDMIGRPQGRILVSGVDTAPSLDADVKAAAQGRALEVRSFREGAGVGSSDDTSFVLRRVPSIGFFSGFHADYHRPSDDWDKIDVPGAVEVTRMALALVERLATRPERPAFVDPPAHSRQTARGSSGGGYGAYFGSVPDFGTSETGVKFADVRPGSPADKAGFRRGDVLVEFDGVAIANLYDFTFALRNRHPGDEVTVIVLREGEKVPAKVKLASRE